MMEKRTLGSDLEVSTIGLGCMGFSHAYGAPMPKQETIQMLRYAYELGLGNFRGK